MEFIDLHRLPTCTELLLSLSGRIPQSGETKSKTSTMDPISPSLGAAASAARFIAQLGAVKDETGVVIEQVKVVANDIAEAERLYLKQKPYMIDGEQIKVEDVIRNTKVAVNRIAREVEPARKSVIKVGTVNVVDRVDWILRRQGSAETYQRNVETCHRSLLDRMSMLRALGPNPGYQTFPLPGPITGESYGSRTKTQSDSDDNGQLQRE